MIAAADHWLNGWGGVTTVKFSTVSGTDARELANSTGFTTTASPMTATSDASSTLRSWFGARFTGVSIPPGSSIQAAKLTVNVTSSKGDDINVTVRAEAVDNSADFITTAALASRSKTGTTVSWVAIDTGLGTRDSPDVASVIAAVTNRAGWATGNALLLLLGGNTDLSYNAYIDAGTTCTIRASLTVDYSAGPPVGTRFLTFF